MSIETSIKKLLAYTGIDVNRSPQQEKPKFDPKVNCGACYISSLDSRGVEGSWCFYTCDFTTGRTASQECDRVAELLKKEGRLIGSPRFVVGEKCR